MYFKLGLIFVEPRYDSLTDFYYFFYFSLLHIQGHFAPELPI